MKNRWKVEMKDFKLVAEPVLDEMSSYLNGVTNELARKCAAAEQLLIIRNSTDDTLKEMKKQITAEQKRRKDFVL